MDLSHYDANPIALFSFLTVLYGLLIAFWGLFLNPRARTNQSFFFMCLHAMVWQLGIGFMLCSRDPGLAERWYRFSYLGVVFIGPGTFLFTSSITHRAASIKGRILAGYVLSFLFGLEGVLGKSAISGMWQYPWGFYPRYGPLGLIFLALFLLLMIAVFHSLFRALQRAQAGLEKKQIKALTIAFSIAYLAALDFVPCFGIQIYPVGFLPIAVFVTLMFRSIYRYQLLDPSPESLARNVIATIADSIIVLDADGFIRMVNPKLGELLGYTKKELLHRHFSSLVDPRSADTLQSLLSDPGPNPEKEEKSGVITLRSKEGKSIPTSCNLSAIRDWKGNRLGAVLACRDLQEILRSKEIILEQEEALRETQERYSALFNRSLFCVFVHDFEGNFLDANEAALRLLGYTREEISSISIASLLTEDQVPEVVESLEHMKRKEAQKELTTWKLKRKDGSFVWVETEASLIDRCGKPYAIQGIAHDISERKLAEEERRRHHEHLRELVEERTAELRRANQELQREIAERIQFEERLRSFNEELDRWVRERTAELEKANEELKQLDKMKDSFLSSVSHELRTPLTSIRSFSEILLRYDDEEEPATRKEFLGIINSESERLTRLINDVLDLSRIEAGGMIWNDGLVCLDEVIQDTLRAHQRLLDEMSLKVILELSPDIPSVLADRDRIHQVIANLVGNAIKFSDRGGEIRIQAMTFKGSRSGETSPWIKVSISDQGIGIEEKDFDVIFDRFRQVSADTLKHKPRGTGLGLSICKDIINHYGGNIWVQSQKGKGSTFFFTLPAARADGDVVNSVLRTSAQPASNPKGKTILVVEENLNAKKVLCSQLERKGFTVLESSDVEKLLDLARNQHIDLILLDLMIPRLGEDDILSTLRERPETRKIPVLIISVVESAESGILPGAHDFLRKPFRAEDLIRKVQRLLEDRDRSILIVDDDPGVRNSLRLQLEDLGYPVYLAEDGDEAVDLLKVSVPDLVILDLAMPGKSGHEVLSWIRNNPDTRDLPVIVLSAFPLFGELDRLRALGIEAFVAKSDDPSSLFNKINSILDVPIH